MNVNLSYFEVQMERLKKRIKKIEENPDPSRPFSNKFLYEMELDHRRLQIEHWKEGKPFAFYTNVTRALGFAPWDGIRAADSTYGAQAKRYFEIIRREGYSEHGCDRTIVILPMVLQGEFPPPSLVLNFNFECESLALAFNTLAHCLNIPSFTLDFPFDSDYDSLKYVADQLGELIEFAEWKFPGMKFSQEKFLELQALELEWEKLHRDLHELRRRVPCPLPGKENFRELRRPCGWSDPKRYLQWLRLLRDEMYEKVEKGSKATAGEEKLRFLWAVTGPFYIDPFAFLEERGVSVPYWAMGFSATYDRYPMYGDTMEYGRKLTPLEEEARFLKRSNWARLGFNWVDEILFLCRDLKLDGVVYFLQWGCTVTNSLGKVVADAVEKKLGIPTLLIEGRMLDSEYFTGKEFFEKLDDFVRICLARKGLA